MSTKYTHFEKLTEAPKLGKDEKIEVSLNKSGDHFIITFRNLYTRKNYDTGEEEKIPCGPSTAAKRWGQRFLEVQHLRTSYPTERISVPVVDTSAIILASWPISQTFYRVEALREVLKLKATVEIQRAAACRVANYLENGVFENGQHLDTGKYALSNYQKVALQACSEAVNYALFMEQGTGKTAVAVTRISVEAKKARKEGKHYRAIIVCPKNVRYNWTQEVKKFATCTGKVRVISGDHLDRGKQLVESLVAHDKDDFFTVLVMNYETLGTCLQHFQLCKALLSQTEGFDFANGKLFDLGLLDESHYIKTPSAKRTKSCHKLREECSARMVLTGTPITNNPFDIWSQLEYLEAGQSGFSSFGKFKAFYGIFESGQMGYEKLVELQNIPLLKERLSRVSFSISKQVALPDLPSKVYDNYEVEMTAEQIELYKKIAAELVAEIETEQAQGLVKKEFMVNHILTKLLRLAQVTSGFVGFPEVVDEETEEVIEERSTHVLKVNPKIDALVEILKEKQPNEKTIVWATFVQDIESIRNRLTAEGIKFVEYYGSTSEKAREDAVRNFNEDTEVKVFLGNPAAASTGINLLGYPPERPEDYDTNCNHVIYFSQNWSADKRIQSEDRCNRRGTRVTTRITELVVPGTIDSEIRQRVEAKREMAADVGNVEGILQSLLIDIQNL